MSTLPFLKIRYAEYAVMKLALNVHFSVKCTSVVERWIKISLQNFGSLDSIINSGQKYRYEHRFYSYNYYI